MFFLASTAASSAMDLISSLRDTISGRQKNGAGVTQGATFDTSAATNSGASTPQAGSLASPQSLTSSTMMNALFAVQEQNQTSGTNSLSSQLFSLIDANGDGSISKDEFEKAFAANGDTTKADSVFAKLDTNQDGKVSQSEMSQGLQGSHHHHHHGMGGMGGSGGAGGLGGLGGASDGTSNSNNSGTTSQTLSNSDGSTTTTITYADGSTVSMTRPASNSSGTPNNFLERMIQRQAQTYAASTAGQSVAVTA